MCFGPLLRPAALLALAGAPGVAMAMPERMDLTAHWVGFMAIALFVIAYGLVMAEEFTHLRKSKPMIIAAGIIWAAIGLVYTGHGDTETAQQALRHYILEFAELGLFLLVAMTYINAMEERRVFDALRSWLVRSGFGFRQLFWITGVLAFFISPVADNLTTALLMATVVLSVGGGNVRFVTLACINIVVAANAGGAFSPFGDITTLMVWQKGIVEFWGFFALFIPAVVNFLIPALLMHFAVPRERPVVAEETVTLHRGARRIILLFVATIATAVVFHNFLHLPPVVGMLTGMGYLQIFGYYLSRTPERDRRHLAHNGFDAGELGDIVPFDVFRSVARAEWDTLFFFYGVVACVGGLGFIGYLGLVSQAMYSGWGATYANVAVGVLSAIVDNIPVMFAVLSMDPAMSHGQWLLVTLTAGVGGSLLSVGSAAGVALMGLARGKYTFFGHLRWTPVILLGYAGSIVAHFWINERLF